MILCFCCRPGVEVPKFESPGRRPPENLLAHSPRGPRGLGETGVTIRTEHFSGAGVEIWDSELDSGLRDHGLKLKWRVLFCWRGKCLGFARSWGQGVEGLLD